MRKCVKLSRVEFTSVEFSCIVFPYLRTRRERLKSAPYLRLKKLKIFEIVKGGPFGFFGKKRKIYKNLEPVS